MASVQLYLARGFLHDTNARSAHRWAFTSFVVLISVWLSSISPYQNAFIRIEAIWYIAAILLLAPFVSILGARHPTNKFWSLFVVLPLMFVLGFPLLVTWVGGSLQEEFYIQPPILIGFFLVLMMSVGNYFGTSFTLPAILAGSSVVLIVVPLTTTVPSFFPAKEHAFPAAVITHSIAIIWVYLITKRNQYVKYEFAYDRLWINFRDLFGIVWAKRVAEQVNQAAEKNHWQVRLELHGFVWLEDKITAEQKAETITGIDQQLRWALSRFVSESWIERQLGK